MKGLRIFWEFSRPHTLIGSTVSVGTLGYLVLGADFYLLSGFWLALGAALACNVFITGYNQVVDVALDKLNKPWLPLASGALDMRSGRIIVFSALGIALVLAALMGFAFLLLISSIAALGFAYSWKHTFLKRRHSTAALAITVVRGVMVNLGFYAVFSGVWWPGDFPSWVWLLSLFVCLFSMGIAWFKDIPDLQGDAAHHIGTLAVRLGAVRVFRMATGVVMLGYLSGILWPFVLGITVLNGVVLSVGHLVLGLLFMAFAAKTAPADGPSMKRFYMLFWVLFFLEYLLFAMAKLLA